MLSLDFQDICLHIPILPGYQHYLQFVVGEIHRQLAHLTLGLSTSQRTFIKVLPSTLAALQEERLHCVPLMENKVMSVQECVQPALCRSLLSAYHFLKFLGTLSSCILIIKQEHWNLRPFQRGFLNQWNLFSLHQDRYPVPCERLSGQEQSLRTPAAAVPQIPHFAQFLTKEEE